MTERRLGIMIFLVIFMLKIWISMGGQNLRPFLGGGSELNTPAQ